MPFHAPFALVSIKSGQDLSLGIRLTTFCFSGKVLTALRFPSLRPHASINRSTENNIGSFEDDIGSFEVKNLWFS